MHMLTVVSLWIIWWCSFAALAASAMPRTMGRVVLSLGLQALMVSSFIGAITVFMSPRVLPFWAHLFVTGVATVSLWLYDARFGIARHAGMVRAAASCFFGRMRGGACMVAAVLRQASSGQRGRRP